MGQSNQNIPQEEIERAKKFVQELLGVSASYLNTILGEDSQISFAELRKKYTDACKKQDELKKKRDGLPLKPQTKDNLEEERKQLQRNLKKLNDEYCEKEDEFGEYNEIRYLLSKKGLTEEEKAILTERKDAVIQGFRDRQSEFLGKRKEIIDRIQEIDELMDSALTLDLYCQWVVGTQLAEQTKIVDELAKKVSYIDALKRMMVLSSKLNGKTVVVNKKEEKTIVSEDEKAIATLTEACDEVLTPEQKEEAKFTANVCKKIIKNSGFTL